ncbi:MAG: hypothetical protein FWD73_14760 [Polyangiaceae bacterium]|nr:hypothetical protein [Polyangiaceae bacterium]
MSTQASPYREEDAEARAQLDAKLREELVEKERLQREELAEQARLRELSRHALAKKEEKEEGEDTIRRFGWVISAAVGLVVGAALGGVGWWATDDLSVLVLAPIVGIIFGVVVVGLWNKPEGKFLGAPPNKYGEGSHDF